MKPAIFLGGELGTWNLPKKMSENLFATHTQFAAMNLPEISRLFGDHPSSQAFFAEVFHAAF